MASWLSYITIINLYIVIIFWVYFIRVFFIESVDEAFAFIRKINHMMVWYIYKQGEDFYPGSVNIRNNREENNYGKDQGNYRYNKEEKDDLIFVLGSAL